MNERDCDRVILRLLDNVSDGCEYREWDKTLDQSALNIIMHNMSEDVRAFIDSALSGIKLPITGAHGDLIQQNFLGSSYDVKIIDWEFYREHGSIVSDVLRYFMVKRSRFNGVSFLSPESLNVNLLPNSLHKLVKLNSQFEIDTQLKVLGVIGNGTAFWNEELGVKQAKKIDRFMSEYMMLNNFGSLAY